MGFSGIRYCRTQGANDMRQKSFNSRPDYEVSDKPRFEDWDEALESQAPFPTFKAGAIMTQSGIYVDENQRLWYIDPEEGIIDLIEPDKYK
jgi:hypothetical protein